MAGNEVELLNAGEEITEASSQGDVVINVNGDDDSYNQTSTEVIPPGNQEATRSRRAKRMRDNCVKLALVVFMHAIKVASLWDVRSHIAFVLWALLGLWILYVIALMVVGCLCLVVRREGYTYIILAERLLDFLPFVLLSMALAGVGSG